MSVSSSTVLAGWGDDGSFVVFFLDLKNNKPTTTHLNLYYKINTLVLYLSVKISVSLTDLLDKTGNCWRDQVSVRRNFKNASESFLSSFHSSMSFLCNK